MVTRLYFHAALNTLANLPTTEQSSLTADKNGDPQSTNRLMDTTTGLAQTSVNLASNATVSLQRYYFTAFVTAPLSGITSITAQTWTYNYAAMTSNTSGNFPAQTAGSVPVRITLYVWRPSTQTKVGNVLDGTGGLGRGTSATVERNHAGTFTGALVSGVQDGDVLVFEVWFEVTQSIAASYTDTFFYDGTTVQATNFSLVSNHASFIETPQNLAFGSINQNLVRSVSEPAVTISESVSRTEGNNRSVAVQTVSISDSVTRKESTNRSVSVQTTTISDSVTRKEGTNRSVAVQTTTVSESLTRRKGANRSTGAQTTTISDSVTRREGNNRAVAVQTTTISDSVIRRKAVNRSVALQTVAISEAVSRAGAAFRRAVTTQVTNISESLTRRKAANRSVTPQTVPVSESVSRAGAAFRRAVTPQTVPISESVTRKESTNRSVSVQNTTISDSVTRKEANNRIVTPQTVTVGPGVTTRSKGQTRTVTPQTISISDSVTRMKQAIRAVSTQVTAISDSLTRRKAANRSVTPQTVPISESVTRSTVLKRVVSTQVTNISDSVVRSAGVFNRVVSTQVTAISDSVTRKKGANRIVPTQTVTVGPGVVTRTKAAIRSVATQTVIVGGGTATRLKAATRIVATQTVTIGESVTRSGAFKRVVSQTVAVFDNVVGLKQGLHQYARGVVEPAVVIADLVTRQFKGARNVSPQTVTISESVSRKKAANRSIGVNTNSLFFNGTDARLNLGVVPNAWNKPNLAAFSISLWIRPQTVGDPFHREIFTRNWGGAYGFDLYYLASSQRLQFESITDTWSTRASSGYSLIPVDYTKWYNVVVVYDSTQTAANVLKMYTNGSLAGFTQTTGVPGWVHNQTTIAGLFAGTPNDFHGWAKDLRWYNRALTAAEAQAISLDVGDNIPYDYRLPMDEGTGISKDTVNASSPTPIVGGGLTWATEVPVALSEAVLVSDSVTRQASKARIVPLESTPIGETVSRLLTAFRSIVQSITVTGSATRSKAASRPVATQSTPVSDSVTRKAAKNRIVAAQNTPVTGSVVRMKGALRSILETVTVAGSAIRSKAATRTVTPQSTPVSDSVTRKAAKNRIVPTESVIVSAAVSRMKAAKRTVTTQVINIFEAVTSTKNTAAVAYTRFVSEPPVLVSDFVTRVVSIRRTIVSFLTISDSTSRSKSMTRTVTAANIIISDTVTAGKNLAKQLVRTVTEPLVAISDFVSRKLQLTRTVSEVVGGVPVLKPGEVPDTVKAQRAICSFLRANWSIPDPPSLDILWDSWYTGQDDITIQCEEMVTTQRPQASNWQLRTYDGFVNIHIFVREQSGLYPERLDKIRAFIDSLFSQNPTGLQVQGIDLMWPYIFTPIRYDKDPNWFHLIVRIQLKYFKQWPPS